MKKLAVLAVLSLFVVAFDGMGEEPVTERFAGNHCIDSDDRGDTYTTSTKCAEAFTDVIDDDFGTGGSPTVQGTGFATYSMISFGKTPFNLPK